MTDSFPDVSPAARRTMLANKAKDTKPEMAVRRLLHRMGYRYRLHQTDLPGRPDLVFGPRRKVIFVHGCFWHRHTASACNKATMPKSRVGYWAAKFARNVERDADNARALVDRGWQVMIVWECDTTNDAQLSERPAAFLEA